MKVANSVNMVSSIARIVTSRTHFGFLSGSHTAEDVFLAAYHPRATCPWGAIPIRRFMPTWPTCSVWSVRWLN